MALETSQREEPGGGTSGLEVELNVLDSDLAPVERIGSGPEARSFADALHDELLPEWARPRFQLEVFHWMTELTTPPCYDARVTAAVARLLEASLLDTLADVGLAYGTRLFAMHGPAPVADGIGEEAVPEGWNLARRRYLAQCVALYGRQLATAGIHTNHSFPDALLSWDFFHLPLAERSGRNLESFRNEAVIRATRLLRPYCPLFIAVSAASPLSWEMRDGRVVPRLTGADSQRLLRFPNPATLDVPGLYASHGDYLRISYDLVRSGARFGANNWTPVRARSDVDPVNRNISTTAEQLRELYRRGLYSSGAHGSLEAAERTLIVENLCARVDLPMNRVEVRTDEGGDDLELSVAKIVFKDLLMLRIYGDPEHGAVYSYSADDVGRARRNESIAAHRGLEAEIEDPFGRGRLQLREWLAVVLEEIRPLAEALDRWRDLAPISELAAGGPNPAQRIRSWMLDRLGRAGSDELEGGVEVPRELVCEWIEERSRRVAREVEGIVADLTLGGSERGKLMSLCSGLEEMSFDRPGLPVRVRTGMRPLEVAGFDDRTAAVVTVAAELIRFPSVTNCPEERLDEVARCGRFIAGWLREAGLEVRVFGDGRYPAILAGAPGRLLAPVTLCGHFDVVKPEPDDSQFSPRLQGDYLWGRGAADMKTVVASMMLWLAEQAGTDQSCPPVNLLLVGNEENGEAEPWGTPQVLATCRQESGWSPELMLVGERTGEEGSELFGQVCTASRGIIRMRIVVRGRRGHTGTSAVPGDLLDRLIELRQVLGGLLARHLTLSSTDGWESAARFPFLNVGEAGVYNITAGEGLLGVEIRPIPEDDVFGLVDQIRSVTEELGAELEVEIMENGVRCPPDNPWLGHLLAAVEEVSGSPTVIGRKKPGSSARFAPGGNQVVWGQTGIGPHSRDERHYIPSIAPYLQVLDALAKRLV